jgi:Flp pilus assembly protein CpaB
MSASELLLLLAALLVVAGLLAYVGRPLWRGEGDAPPADPRAVALLLEREAVLAALRDLDADHAAGRLPDEIWRTLRADAVARGAAVLAALDDVAADAAGNSARYTEAIEAEVALRSGEARPATLACRRCGAGVKVEDQFCARCGQPLGLPAEVSA